MKKILILGSGGMLGHIVYHFLKSLDKYTISDASFPHKANDDSYLLDVTNGEDLESIIYNTQPDIVINCIGILLKGSNENPSDAIYLNAYFPHQLSKLLFSYGGKLIHISTDCVFNGEIGGYIETDFKDARDIYGLSKALGEINNNHDLTLRTSIIGPELNKNGEGLFHWFMNQSGAVNGFTKMIWGGVTTLELAKVIESAIEQDITGLIHITNKEPISKFALISLFKEIWKTDHITIGKLPGKSVNKSLKSCRDDFNYVIPSYRTMILELYQWMENYHCLYENIYSINENNNC